MAKEHDYAVADWIDLDLKADRNWVSQIPEWLGVNPFKWPRTALYDYLKVNGKTDECMADVRDGVVG